MKVLFPPGGAAHLGGAARGARRAPGAGRPRGGARRGEGGALRAADHRGGSQEGATAGWEVVYPPC